MTKEPSEKVSQVNEPAPVDDPLAELARIVSSGSVFGDVSGNVSPTSPTPDGVTQQKEAPPEDDESQTPDPVVDAAVDELAIPPIDEQVLPIGDETGISSDFDDIGALISELVENEVTASVSAEVATHSAVLEQDVSSPEPDHSVEMVADPIIPQQSVEPLQPENILAPPSLEELTAVEEGVGQENSIDLSEEPIVSIDSSEPDLMTPIDSELAAVEPAPPLELPEDASATSLVEEASVMPQSESVVESFSASELTAEDAQLDDLPAEDLLDDALESQLADEIELAINENAGGEIEATENKVSSDDVSEPAINSDESVDPLEALEALSAAAPAEASVDLDVALADQLESELVSELQLELEDASDPIQESDEIDVLALEQEMIAASQPLTEEGDRDANTREEPLVVNEPRVDEVEIDAASSGQDAIEDALNLDSFFDEEFASVESGNPENDAAGLEPVFADAPLSSREIAALHQEALQVPRSEAPIVSPDLSTEGKADFAEALVEDIDPLETIEFIQADASEFADQQGFQSRFSSKLLIAIAAILLFFVATGVGSYFLLNGFSESDVVVIADDDPIKVKPDDPGGKTIENQGRTVYETIAGSDELEKEQERLIDRTEVPIVVELGRESEPAPRVTLDARNQNAQGASTRPPSGPRTVRTVVVRPDGTLVQPKREETAEETTPGVEAQQTRPSIVASNNSPISSESDGGNAAATGVQETIDNTSEFRSGLSANVDDASSPLSDTLDNGASLVEEGQESVRRSSDPLGELLEEDENTSEQVADEPVVTAALPPVPRANTFRRTTSAQQTQPQPVTPASAPAAPAPSVESPASGTPPAISAGGGVMVQLAAARTDGGARETFSSLQRRFNILQNYDVNVQRVDLGERGVFHRIRVGPFNRADAASLCENLKASGGDCILRNN